MDPIYLMINGMPGNVAIIIARHVLKDNRFSLVPFSLTGPDILHKAVKVETQEIQLVKPQGRETIVGQIKARYPGVIAVDFTHPTAVNANAELYASQGIPFVMGTTGGNREKLLATVSAGSVPAVIAPNMAKQIVGFQAMMDYAASTFPGLFEGYTLTIEESHQKGKADTSGTARAMVGCFNRLGIPFTSDQITMERDPEIQASVWKVPREHLAGHGWHTYTLTSPDGSAFFQFKHNINGRDIYVNGTLDGVLFLHEKIGSGDPAVLAGQCFSMIDVLKKNRK
ncbi:MAG: dihydrodipicolinate reductase [Pseudomonadota bacterium]